MIEQPASISAPIGTTFTDFVAGYGCEAAWQMRRRIAPRHWAHVVAASQGRGIAGISCRWLARCSEGAPQLQGEAA